MKQLNYWMICTKMMKEILMNNAIILLSGGLDSVVSLAIERQNYDNIFALTFNYGQMSFLNEKIASEKIANYYNIEHKIIDLLWLSEFYSDNIPELTVNDLDNSAITHNSAKAVWIPNRNALFVNIAACYADSLNYNCIIIGANKEEAQTFKDNSADFINSINLSLKNSCNNNVVVQAPLINKTKNEIIETGIHLNVPFELISSCYNSGEKHCGKCESCLRLKRALEYNKREDIIKKLF